MVKLLLIGIIPVIITIGIIFLLTRPQVPGPNQNNRPISNSSSDSGSTDSQPGSSFADLNDDTITRSELENILEASMSAVNARIDALAVKTGVSIPTVAVSAPGIIPTPAPVAAAVTTGPKVAYIPLGSSGSSTSLNAYENISSTEIVIDPANYPGYKDMVLEAQMRIFQGNGKGDGRIFDETDGLGMIGSEISTTSETFGLQTSTGFKVPGGKKTYVVQLKSNTGYSVDLQTTRIRVEF